MPVVAKETVFVAGHRAPIQRGKLYDDDDPVVVSHPTMFEPAEDAARRAQQPMSTADLGQRSMTARRVEQATAAPGEQRTTSHPCDQCDYVGASRRGLKAHQRKHKNEDG